MNINDFIKGQMPNTNEPIIFLDFDDVINVFGDYRNNADVVCEKVIIPRGTQRPCIGTVTLEEDKVMEIAWRPSVIEILKDMNVLWCTSWKHLTQTLLNPTLGTDFGYVDWMYRGFSDDGRYGKSEAIANIAIELNLPFVAIDDSFWGWNDIFTNHLAPSVPSKVIVPQYDEGLTLQQLEEALEFVNAYL